MSVVTAAAPVLVENTNRRSDEWATVVFGMWMITGLFLDGWAHASNKPETFFSPWHGVLYSGFAAGTIYAAIEGYRARARGESFQMERLMGIGFICFGIAGVGDMIWHQIFGIEVGIEALLSPSHLALFIGGLLMVTQPLRAAWHDPDDRSRTASFVAFFPTVASVTLATALASFFTMYASAFPIDLVSTRTPAFEALTSHGVAAILLTNAMLMIPMLVLRRRWQVPFGAFTFLFGGVAFAMTGLEAFERLPVVLAAVAGGLTADLMRERSVRLAGAAVPFVTWASYFVIAHRTFGLGWQVELWSGALVLCVLSGLGLTYLVSPPEIGSPERSRAAVS